MPVKKLTLAMAKLSKLKNVCWCLAPTLASGLTGPSVLLFVERKRMKRRKIAHAHVKMEMLTIAKGNRSKLEIARKSLFVRSGLNGLLGAGARPLVVQEFKLENERASMALLAATVKAKRQKFNNAKLTSAQPGQIGWMRANAQLLVESEPNFGDELVEKV